MSYRRYRERYRRETVNQWSRCYLNYEHFKNLITLLRDCVREATNLQQLLKCGVSNGSNKQLNQQRSLLQVCDIPQQQRELMESHKMHFRRMGDEVNEMFIESYTRNIELFEDFTNFKYQQIQNNFHACWTYNYLIKFQVKSNEEKPKGEKAISKSQFDHYLQYLYVEANFLSRMVRSNLQAQGRILEQHKMYSLGVFHTPDAQVSKHLSIDKVNVLKQSIQNYYIEVNKRNVKSSRTRITKLGLRMKFSSYESLSIGLLLGSIVTIIIFMCVILARAQIALQGDPIFNQHFPLWRGISFYIFYTWMLAVNVFYFERYKINHRIILENKYVEYPKSTDLFKIASFFSIIFVICFIFYALQISSIMSIAISAPMLPLFVWGSFIVFLFNPFPCGYFWGRLFIFKMLFKVVATLVVPADLLAVIATTQLFALINAVNDTVYSICYYTNLPTPLVSYSLMTPDICKPHATQAKFYFTISLYSLRIYHCLRGIYSGWGKTKLYKTIDFLNTIKFSFGLTTAVLSYVYNSNRSQLFPAWLIFAIITSLYSFVWDVKMSFDVFNLKAKHFLLRDQIIFPKKNYYFWIASTFVLRCTFSLYISPNISKTFLGSPQIFLLVFGYLQIIRRGLWNTLRLQLQQVRYKIALRALPKQKQTIQQQIYKYIAKNKDNLNSVSLQSIVAAGDEFVRAQAEKKQQNQKIKKTLISDAKILFDQQLSQKLVMQEYNKKNQDIINFLLENIY